MKTFGEFYREVAAPGYYSKHKSGRYFVEGCGDRSVLRLDGRVKDETRHQWCIEWAEKYGFDAYRISRGDSLLRLSPMTDLVIMETEK